MPHAPRIAVVIPALDEAESLPGVLADLPPVDRVLVVDNGSTDGTSEVARVGGAEVLHEPRRGYGSAVQCGIRALVGDEPDVLVILDADHADRPDLLHRLVDPILADEADLVLSERTATAEPGAMTPAQRYGNRLATRLMSLASGYAFRDLGPFRAIRWSSLVALGMVDATWGWNVEMGLKAVRHDLRILEVPMPYRRRHAGRSKISGTVRGTVRAGARILWAVARYR